MITRRTLLAALIVINLIIGACKYIVLPEGLDIQAKKISKGWSGVATSVGPGADGSLRIEITIRNETNDWSAMKAVEGKPAILKGGDGKTANCATVFVGTGGHRLAPGFQMRGYTAGTRAEPKTQLIYAECAGAQAAPGSELSIDYASFQGELDYYHQDEGAVSGTMKINLDEIAADLAYPVFAPVDGLIVKPDVSFTGISDNVVTLLDVQRTETGLEFKWQNQNPTEFALKCHIGRPPVIGADGIIYGLYEIMDLSPTPLTPAGGSVEWTTEVAVPPELGGYYILMSVESKQMRLYVNYAIDITDK